MVTLTTVGLSLRIVCSGKRTCHQQHEKEGNMSTKFNRVSLINYYENFGEITQKEMKLPPNEKTMDKHEDRRKEAFEHLIINENKTLSSKNVRNGKLCFTVN